VASAWFQIINDVSVPAPIRMNFEKLGVHKTACASIAASSVF